MTDVFEPSENGPSQTKVGRAQSRDECQKNHYISGSTIHLYSLIQA
jgi:hypothetical protein